MSGRRPPMTSDPGTARRAPRWEVRLYVAYLRAVRHALQYRILPLGWAMRMAAPFFEAAGDSCPARYGRGVDIRTARFGFLAEDCGDGTFSEILAFFRAPGDGDDVDDENVLLAHELEVPVGSPIDNLAQAICDDPGAAIRVGERLRSLVAACPCAGYDECPALSAHSVVTAMELAVGGKSPALPALPGMPDSN